MAQPELNSIDGIKLALERHQFAAIMTASAEIQSRLVLTIPLKELDCALLAAAIFARAAALVCYREYSDGRREAQRGLRTMCVLGPDTDLVELINKAVAADFSELEMLGEAETSVEKWLRSESLDTEKRRALQCSPLLLHPSFVGRSREPDAVQRQRPLQAAMTIGLMRDLVEVVGEWARVCEVRLKLEQDGGEAASANPAYSATAAGFAERTTTLYAVRSRDGKGDSPLISVPVGVRI